MTYGSIDLYSLRSHPRRFRLLEVFDDRHLVGFQSSVGAHTIEVSERLTLTSHTHCSRRKFCGKLNPPSVLLPKGDSEIWEKSKVIEHEDTQLVETILVRYGFNEVNTGEATCANHYGIVEGIDAGHHYSSTVRRTHL